MNLLKQAALFHKLPLSHWGYHYGPKSQGVAFC